MKSSKILATVAVASVLTFSSMGASYAVEAPAAAAERAAQVPISVVSAQSFAAFDGMNVATSFEGEAPLEPTPEPEIPVTWEPEPEVPVIPTPEPEVPVIPTPEPEPEIPVTVPEVPVTVPDVPTPETPVDQTPYVPTPDAPATIPVPVEQAPATDTQFSVPGTVLDPAGSAPYVPITPPGVSVAYPAPQQGVVTTTQADLAVQTNPRLINAGSAGKAGVDPTTWMLGTALVLGTGLLVRAGLMRRSQPKHVAVTE